MGRSPGSIISDYSSNCTRLLRRENAATHIGHLRSDSSTNGCRSCRRMAGLSGAYLVALSALDSAGIVFVHMLVYVSDTVYVEKAAAARQCSNARRLHCGWRQCDAMSAAECLPVCIFGADGSPLVMVMPMLYAGMLLGGVSALSGLIVVLLLIAATFVANVLAGVIALFMLRRQANRTHES